MCATPLPAASLHVSTTMCIHAHTQICSQAMALAAGHDNDNKRMHTNGQRCTAACAAVSAEPPLPAHGSPAHFALGSMPAHSVLKIRWEQACYQ